MVLLSIWLSQKYRQRRKRKLLSGRYCLKRSVDNAYSTTELQGSLTAYLYFKECQKD